MKLLPICLLLCGVFSAAGCLTAPDARPDELGTSTQEVTECGSEGDYCYDVCASSGAVWDGCMYGACHCFRGGPGGNQTCERIFGGYVCWSDDGGGKYI